VPRLARQAICLQCGKDFVAVGSARGKYCSGSCAAKHRWVIHRPTMLRAVSVGAHSALHYSQCRVCRSVIGPARLKPSNVCANCIHVLGDWAARALAPDLLRARLNGRPCKTCGQLFSPSKNKSVYCSHRCGKRTESHRVLHRQFKALRKARAKSNGPHERINPLIVFNRGGWVCYLCKCDTPKELRGTIEPNAPEVEHIIPLARGGFHTYGNVACCCRACNIEKSDGVAELVDGVWRVEHNQQQQAATA